MGATWRAGPAGIDPRQLAPIDVTRIDHRLSRVYGRAPPRAAGHGQDIVTLALDGMLAAVNVDAATGAALLPTFVERVLVPALKERPDAIVIIGNLVKAMARSCRSL
jgi:hypothetical protein